ncbi:MAG: hypothetical protein MJ151_02705, partial [Lachnospiraceae bacterium]|nr:hypothetical protein [Lachnospiraceae bacterium]
MMVDHADMINKILMIYLFIVIITFILLSIFSDIVYKKFIPYMKEKHMGQVIRKEGMKTHYKKEGTPTMGGAVFGIIFVGFGALYTLVKIV